MEWKIVVVAALAFGAGCAEVWVDGDASAGDVVAIDWTQFPAAPPDDDNAQTMRAILANANRYALTSWYDAHGWDPATPYLDLGGTDEHAIRPVASEAFALAVALQLGAYDEAVTGVSAPDAGQRAVQLVASVAAAHRSNGGGWGGGWQTALWAAYAGTAGWLLRDRLSPADARNVARMVQSEARRFVGFVVPYFRDRDGTVISNGDSKAEEDAWNAQLLYLAVNMMPGDRHVAAWEYKAAELAVGSFARPTDVHTHTEINGRTLDHWLHGSNANADGTVINHEIVHPDYIVTASYTASAPLWYGLRRRATPDAMFAGVAGAYAALSEKNWKAGTSYPETTCGTTCECDDEQRCKAREPGGPIYVGDSSVIYFPHGNDWGGERSKIHFAAFDAMAHAFELDRDLQVRAAQWEVHHARAARDLQRLSSDGRSYTDAAQDTYLGREEWVAAHAALAWFAKFIATQGAYSRTNAPLDIVIDDQDREHAILRGTWNTQRGGHVLGTGAMYTTKAQANDGARVGWETRLAPGVYRVEAWWPRAQDLATRAMYSIEHANGVSRLEVDQRAGDGWFVLGTFELTERVGVELAGRNADGALVADGIRFRRVTAGSPSGSATLPGSGPE